jgi:hypothetical protein
MQQILELLSKGPASIVEMTEYLPWARSGMSRQIRKLRDMREIHICSYRRNLVTKGRGTPVYVLGPGRDAKEPRYDHATCMRDYYARHKARILAAKRKSTNRWLVIAGMSQKGRHANRPTNPHRTPDGKFRSADDA